MGAEAGRWPSCLSVAGSGLGSRKKLAWVCDAEPRNSRINCIGVYAII